MEFETLGAINIAPAKIELLLDRPCRNQSSIDDTVSLEKPKRLRDLGPYFILIASGYNNYSFASRMKKKQQKLYNIQSKGTYKPKYKNLATAHEKRVTSVLVVEKK